MTGCPFCRISQGEADAEILYADERVIAMLDARPIRPGHTLVIPREHVGHFYEMDDDLAWSLWRVVQRVARRVDERLSPKAVGLIAAGWDVPHTHAHVIPMLDYHDITSKRLLEGRVISATKEELAHQAALLRDNA